MAITVAAAGRAPVVGCGAGAAGPAGGVGDDVASGGGGGVPATTVIVPVMLGWNAHTKRYVPPWSNTHVPDHCPRSGVAGIGAAEGALSVLSLHCGCSALSKT